jgi:hypothetical protein
VDRQQVGGSDNDDRGLEGLDGLQNVLLFAPCGDAAGQNVLVSGVEAGAGENPGVAEARLAQHQIEDDGELTEIVVEDEQRPRLPAGLTSRLRLQGSEIGQPSLDRARGGNGGSGMSHPKAQRPHR